MLLWYTKHFVDTLRDAESKGPTSRLSLAQSPRILGIVLGVIFVLIGGTLSASVLWDAASSKVITIPLWSRGFWLVLLCLAAPFVGAVIVGLVAIAQIGWLTGLSRAAARLLPRGKAKALRAYPNNP